MKNQNKKQNNFEKQFENQKQLQNDVIDRFAKHGHKVKYQFKVIIQNE